MTRVKVGILGAGGIAKVHTSILKKDERVQIIGVADIVEERAASLAKEAGEAKAVKSLEELFDLGVDAVYVTTPNTMHVEPVLKCLENNVHVFSEKPMATSLEGAEQIRQAAERSKAIYNLGMNRRYASVYKRVKELVDSGEVTPYLAHVKMNRGELLNPPWTANPKVTGGFLYETPFHLMDLCRYLFGEVQTVYCEAKQNISTEELDTFAIMMTFVSGTIVNFVTYAHAGWSFPFESLEVYGKYSTVATQELEKVMYAPGLQQAAHIHDFYQLSIEEKWGYKEEDRLFIDAIIHGTKPPVTAEDGFRSIQLLEAIYESAKTGKIIDFRQTAPSK
ncbi:gfo/Idh/MocA family oxidoreductase [Geobacillus thermoleovorans]|uniref:Oxidoreductase n=2 Tax=Geobacillus TaxID=129337 RepID=Q5KYQ2_GEOKA|nr:MULTISPECIES: Gfo/Idh/MocA family oxidoreductase [Geobacillus]AMV11076.1 oxidoreductase [Geobacillus thermoleovorans]KLR73208.1 oxidoreductase [Geobacillus sp. T6]KZE96997.1 scyllo-inositol 2-dehydrogenase (NADP(+)) [Geobacillus stearothermophilus]MCK7606471.1 Gfo/Idh/MocA family oxidoreductase [Geobacillus stearothermophilus]MED4971781.1 Gfo/Idh/MocA family oxidoreductase [Geobacillus thermoleovorans]